VLFELPKDARKAGVAVTDSSVRQAPGLDHIAFEVDSREDWLLALDHVRSCGVEIVSGPYRTPLREARRASSAGAAATPSTSSTRTAAGSRSTAG
jgi:hypothetical protein